MLQNLLYTNTGAINDEELSLSTDFNEGGEFW